jgi:hypothetical protein
MKLCPYCKQDDLWFAAIVGVDDNAVYCGECDTVWGNREAVIDGNGKNFSRFMAAYGKEVDWSLLRIKEKIEE